MNEDERIIQFWRCSWDRANQDYWALRHAVDDILPSLSGYEKGRIERVIDYIDRYRKRKVK